MTARQKKKELVRCSTCKIEKETDYFYTDKSRSNGFMSRCIECVYVARGYPGKGMSERNENPDLTYNEKDQNGQSRFKKGNPGKPQGTKNKLSFQAAERMEELGLDPLQAYVSLLEKARASGNLAVEERCLSRLMQFRWAGLHHSMVTNVDEADLEISVTKFEAPSEWGKGGTSSGETSSLPDDTADAHPGVNVRTFKVRDA